MTASVTIERYIAPMKCDTLRLKPQGVKVLRRSLASSDVIVIPSAARDLLFVPAHGFKLGKLAARMTGALAPEVRP